MRLKTGEGGPTDGLHRFSSSRLALTARPLRMRRNCQRNRVRASSTLCRSDDFDIALGKRLRAQRYRLGLSQAEVGARVGVSFQQIHKYECGKSRISAYVLTKLAAVLSAPLGDLLPELPAMDDLKVVPFTFGRPRRAWKVVTLDEEDP